MLSPKVDPDTARPPRPWSGIYDQADGFVVMAATEEEARLLASCEHGDEGAGAWLDPDLSCCLELVPHNGFPHVVLRDFHAG